MVSKIKEMIKFTDMFYSSEMLRHQDEQEYRTITGGLLSLAIIVTTIVGFASMILETLDRSTITTSVQTIKNTDPTPSTFIASSDQNFMFAIQLWRLNITSQQRYFDVTLAQELGAGEVVNKIYLPLQTCTRQHWTLIPSLQANFDQLNMRNWLCPPIGSNYTIAGKYSSKFYSTYAFTVQGCKNQTDPSRPCASQEKIDELFVAFQEAFYFTLYFTNPTINPGNKDYKSYYIQDENYVLFGSRVGTMTYIFFSDYTINTDYSIWPFKDIEVDEGLIVQNFGVHHPIQAGSDGIFAQIYLAKSPNSIKYTRQVQKITSVFSFIGGMISAASALLFFVKIYTNLSYEISIAVSLFDSKKDKNESSQLHVNFLTFIKFHIYRFFRMVGVKLDWDNIDYISQCQSEIVKQLDISKLIKRFIFIQHCLTYLFDDFQLSGIQLKAPSSLQQIRLIRQRCACMQQDKEDEGSTAQLQEKISNINEFQQEGSLPLESNMQLNKSKRLYQDKIIVQDITDKNNHPRQIKVFNVKKKTINNKNAVDNNFDQAQVREKYLQLLRQHSQKGNEMSKKIWESLSKEVKQKVQFPKADKRGQKKQNRYTRNFHY